MPIAGEKIDRQTNLTMGPAKKIWIKNTTGKLTTSNGNHRTGMSAVNLPCRIADRSGRQRR